MFKRELKYNFKSFILWTIVLVVLFALVFLLYSTFIKSDNLENINEIMKVFSEDVLKMFNLDITHIDTAFGWMETEGFIFLLLITGVYSGMLGCSILTKEEDEKTIEYLHSLPIKRNSIVISKILVGILYIFLMSFILGISNFISLSMLEKFDKNVFILLSISPVFSNIVIFMFSLFVSTFTHKHKKVLPISLAFVFASYLFVTLSELNEKVIFLKYFSVYTLADIRGIISDERIKIQYVLISIVLTTLLIILSVFRYNKKELV